MQCVRLAYGSWASELVAVLEQMRRTCQGCDARLVLSDDSVLSAHTSLLSASSPLFRVALAGTQNPEIDVREFPREHVVRVVDFIYTGELTVTSDELDTLLDVTRALDVPVLTDMIERLKAAEMLADRLGTEGATDAPAGDTDAPSDGGGGDDGTAGFDDGGNDDGGVGGRDPDTTAAEKTPEEEIKAMQGQSLDNVNAVSPIDIRPDSDPDRHCVLVKAEREDGHVAQNSASKGPEMRRRYLRVDVNGSPNKSVNPDDFQYPGKGYYTFEVYDDGDASGNHVNVMTRRSARISKLAAVSHSDDDDDDDAETAEQLSSKQATVRYKIVAGGAKETLISSDGYSYVLQRRGQYGRYWRCVYHTRKPTYCPATVKQPADDEADVDELFVRGPQPHNHPPEVNLLTIKREADTDVGSGGQSDGEAPSAGRPGEPGFRAYQMGRLAPKTYHIATKASRRGKDLLLDSDGYRYAMRRRFKRATLWVCSVRSKTFSCPASVSQKSGGRFVAGRHQHNHPPGSNKPPDWVPKARRRTRPEDDDEDDGSTGASLAPVVVPAAPNQDINGTEYTVCLDEQKRERLIASDGHIYGHKRKGLHAVRWRCVGTGDGRSGSTTDGSKGALSCPAYVRQYPDMFVVGWRKHNHTPPHLGTTATHNVDNVSAVNSAGHVDGTHDDAAATDVNSVPDLSDAAGQDKENAPSDPGAGRRDPDVADVKQETTKAADGEVGESKADVKCGQQSVRSRHGWTDSRGYRIVAKASQSGGDVLVDADGYRYTVKRKQGRKIQWKCAVRNKSLTCPAAVSQIGSRFKRGQYDHKHRPNSNRPLGMENGFAPRGGARKRKPKLEYRTRHPSESEQDFQCDPYQDQYGYKYKVLPKASKTKTDKLVCNDGYSYTARRQGVHGIQWKCVHRHAPFKCAGSVRQIGDFFVRGLRGHNHEPEDGALVADCLDGAAQSAAWEALPKHEAGEQVQQAVWESSVAAGGEWDSLAKSGAGSPVAGAGERAPTVDGAVKTFTILRRASKAGKDILEDSDGYRYNFKSSVGDCINWRCAVRNASLQCPATVKQFVSENRFVPGRLQHKHSPPSTGAVRYANVADRRPELGVLTAQPNDDGCQMAEGIQLVADATQLEEGAQLDVTGNDVVELVLVSEEGSSHRYELTTIDGTTTFQLPAGMVIQTV